MYLERSGNEKSGNENDRDRVILVGGGDSPGILALFVPPCSTRPH